VIKIVEYGTAVYICTFLDLRVIHSGENVRTVSTSLSLLTVGIVVNSSL